MESSSSIPSPKASAAAELQIRAFALDDANAVIALWRDCGLLRPWNDPMRDIERKRQHQPELFLVGMHRGRLVASAMAGYDGHRGSVNYLAVQPGSQRLAFGRAMMDRIEALLTALGCPKINLLVRSGNNDVLGFYDRLGYSRESVVALGKRLIADD